MLLSFLHLGCLMWLCLCGYRLLALDYTIQEGPQQYLPPML